MAGLGILPIGPTPLGAGTPDLAPAPPDGLPDLANFFNSSAGDYVVADDGSLERMPIVRHQVLMLLSTELGTAAHEPSVGLKLPKKMGRDFEQRCREAVLLALEPIGADIRVDGIGVKRMGTGRAEITISFTDLTTGNSDTVTI